jgi:hypothetical protein
VANGKIRVFDGIFPVRVESVYQIQSLSHGDGFRIHGQIDLGNFGIVQIENRVPVVQTLREDFGAFLHIHELASYEGIRDVLRENLLVNEIRSL